MKVLQEQMAQQQEQQEKQEKAESSKKGWRQSLKLINNLEEQSAQGTNSYESEGRCIGCSGGPGHNWKIGCCCLSEDLAQIGLFLLFFHFSRNVIGFLTKQFRLFMSFFELIVIFFKKILARCKNIITQTKPFVFSEISPLNHRKSYLCV